MQDRAAGAAPMRGHTVFLLVPFRVRFAPAGVGSWLRGAVPVFWHHWSERTDLRRVPLARRWAMFWEWWVLRPSTLSLPLESTAVDWWLSRLFRSEHWEWDADFARRVFGPDDEQGRRFGEDALRECVRELLLPRAFVRHLGDELSERDGAAMFVPPVTAVHARLATLPEPVPMLLKTRTEPDDVLRGSLRAVRLHAFRFGDGALSLEIELSPGSDDAHSRSHLRRSCRRLDELEVELEVSRSPLPWHEGGPLDFPSLVEKLLTPAERFDPCAPELQQWVFTWGDRRAPSSERVHRIELPFGRHLAGLYLRRLPSSTGNGPLRALPSKPITPAERSVPFFVEELDEADAERRAVQESRILALLLLAVFRRRKFDEVADLIASGGHDRLGSAQYLEYLSFHLALAEDRFLHDAPVLGAAGRERWDRWSELLELETRRSRVAPAVKALREDYFRGRSLRLVARVTSTFWFLFRWILVPIILVKVMILVGAAVLVGVAGLLTLSLFATTAVWFARRLHGRLVADEDVAPPPAESSAPSAPSEFAAAPDAPAPPSTSSVGRGHVPRDWVFWAGIVELVAIAATAVLWPRMRQLLLPMIGVFAGILVVVGLAGAALLRKRWRRRTFARFFEQDTVPIVALLLLGLAVLAALVILGTIVHDLGWDSLVFRPKFWGDSLPTGGGDGV